MRKRLFVILVVLMACSVLGPIGLCAQQSSCAGFQAESVCAGDLICHFENETCGSVSGNVAFCPGAYGQGLCLNGDGWISLGDADWFSQNVIEIECQVRFSRLPGSGEHASGLVTKYTNHNPELSEWGLFVEGNITPFPTWMLTGDGRQAIRSTCRVQLDSLYCVRAMICGNIGGIWVNGLMVASGPISHTATNTAAPVIIGNAASSAKENRFYGMIDEVRIGCPHDPCAPLGTEETSWGIIKSLYR